MLSRVTIGCDFHSSLDSRVQVKMGKKRGKDKSSREDDDIDLAGKEYVIIFNVILQPVDGAYDEFAVIIYLCIFSFSF